MSDLLKKLGTVLILPVLLLVYVIVFSFPFMFLWNYALATSIEFVNPINIWKAIGLLLLFNIVFGSRHSDTNQS